MRKTLWISALAIVLATSGCTSRLGNPFRVATGYISHVVCSYVFVSGLDAERVYAEEIDANPAFRGFKWALSHHVDRDKHEVRARALGGFETRSVYRDGLGCLNMNGTQSPDAPSRASIEADGPVPVLLPEIARTVYRTFYGEGENRVGVLRALFFELSSLSPDAAEVTRDAIGGLVGSVVLYLMGHMRDGRLRQMHPLLALQSFVGPIFFHLITRPVAEQMLGLDIDGEEAVTLLAENWLRAMTPEETTT